MGQTPPHWSHLGTASMEDLRTLSGQHEIRQGPLKIKTLTLRGAAHSKASFQSRRNYVSTVVKHASGKAFSVLGL